jgi:CheY-like chemotaxis protein
LWERRLRTAAVATASRRRLGQQAAPAIALTADRTATDQAPAVPLATGSDHHLASPRVGNCQYSFQQGVLPDQLWVR